MADKTDTPSPAKRNEQDPPKAEGANASTKGRPSTGGTAAKQPAKAKRARSTSARSTRDAAAKKAAKAKSAVAAEARSTRAAAKAEATKVTQAAEAEARTIKETARADAERVKKGAETEAAQKTKAAADEADRVRQAAQAQARQIRQEAQAEAQEAQSPAPAAGQDRPEDTTGVPSLSDLTRKAWERNMALAMSVVPAYVRMYESTVGTFGAAFREAGATSTRDSATPGSDDGADGSARATALRERRRIED